MAFVGSFLRSSLILIQPCPRDALRLFSRVKVAIALIHLLGLLCLLGDPCPAIAAPSPTFAQSSIAQSSIAQSSIAQTVLQDFEQQQQQREQEQQQLEQQQQQVEQRQQQVEQRQQAVEQATKRIKQAEQSALGDLTDLRDTLLQTEGALADSQARLDVAAQYLKGLEGRLAQSQQTYQKQRNSTVARLQVLQRQQRLQGWAVLLESDSIGAFLQRRYYLKKLYERDRTRLSNLTQQAIQLQQQQEQIEEQKNGIALLRQRQLMQKSGLEQKSKQQAVLIQRLKDNRAALEASQIQLQRDSENLTQLIQELIAKRSVNAGFLGGGPLRMPVAAPISSPFGWRVHPVLGTERFHSGIDFAVDYETSIGAAAGGVVIYADWYGGYGNAVILDHGDGITTLYAHNNELTVSPGQAVQPGQVVSRSGSTGLSTGPHLHFEVRQNGEPVDPMGYL
ncbi:MAG: peptidoglycan DD-metalloendopeptidase family protein [Synechococcales cyanobacterium RU_4_20]|nr:peptidoglycan DD-metalloendopeptidase family protein [Synechococcales cyanobacterium RU_4_20]NJR67492.1 peptidoglycan DD-metalloendopeptidase family protein [Synechococcales cyanobacterium CRU_2_2]